MYGDIVDTFQWRRETSEGGIAVPFRGVSVMEQREGFVIKALEEGANIRGLCRAYGISATTGYRWLERYREKGRAG